MSFPLTCCCFPPEKLTRDTEHMLLTYKLVPWLCWDEWNTVRERLFSSSSEDISSALAKISSWRGRGCIPIVVDVSASIVEIQQQDPFFREDLNGDSLLSEDVLAMLYCMAIIRLVNGVIEKTRKQMEASIAEAATVIGIPRMLVDIRHEGSHRDLPSLHVTRMASIKAIEWLKSYYWDPQRKAILSQNIRISHIQSKIMRRLYELVVILKFKCSISSKPKPDKGMKYAQFCGGKKLLLFASGALVSSKSHGSRRRTLRTLKQLVRLYSSHSSRVISMLMTLLKGVAPSKDYNIPPLQSLLPLEFSINDWKLLVNKIGNKVPQLFLGLLHAILELLAENHRNATRKDSGTTVFSASTICTERFSFLCIWLVENLKILIAGSRENGVGAHESMLVDLLRKCLLVALWNKQLMDCAVLLAQTIGNESLVSKINKYRLVYELNSCVSEETTSIKQQEESFLRVKKKSEFLKSCVMKLSNDMMRSEPRNRWVLAKSWNPCPIGMLSDSNQSSGRLPVLDFNSYSKQNDEPSEIKLPEKIPSGNKRLPSEDVQILGDVHAKRKREVDPENGSIVEDVLLTKPDGMMLIGGVWKRVDEQELAMIQSSVRILF